MSCNHNHHNHGDSTIKLLFTIILNLIISVSQFIGGMLSGSLALMSDALHNLSDVISLIISLIANKLSHTEYTNEKTYGWRRAEILASLFNSTTLFLLALYLMYEAIVQIISNDYNITNVEYIIYLALLSVVVNGVSVLILFKDSKNSINIRSSYLHLLTDMFTSIAVLFGGIIMYFYNIYYIDSILTILIGLYLLKHSIDIIKESSFILLHFTPKDISLLEIEKRVVENKEILNIHHIHIWQLDDVETYMECHIDLKNDLKLSEVDELIVKISKMLKDEFNIFHVTIQPEFNFKDNKSIVVKKHKH